MTVRPGKNEFFNKVQIKLLHAGLYYDFSTSTRGGHLRDGNTFWGGRREGRDCRKWGREDWFYGEFFSKRTSFSRDSSLGVKRSRKTPGIFRNGKLKHESNCNFLSFLFSSSECAAVLFSPRSFSPSCTEMQATIYRTGNKGGRVFYIIATLISISQVNNGTCSLVRTFFMPLKIDKTKQDE